MDRKEGQVVMAEQKPKWVVVDNENEQAVGPFDTKEEAKKYFIALAKYEGWGDVCELIAESGSPFGHGPQELTIMMIDESQGPDKVAFWEAQVKAHGVGASERVSSR